MTTNVDLFRLANQYKIKLDHIIYKDQLDTMIYKPGLNIIINMSNHDHEGTHWVCLVTFKDMMFYSDPFGIEPPIEVINFGKNKKIVYNDLQIESLTGTNCGQLALFTLGLSQNKPLKKLF